jgi:hypothetical protein
VIWRGVSWPRLVRILLASFLSFVLSCFKTRASFDPETCGSSVNKQSVHQVRDGGVDGKKQSDRLDIAFLLRCKTVWDRTTGTMAADPRNGSAIYLASEMPFQIQVYRLESQLEPGFVLCKTQNYRSRKVQFKRAAADKLSGIDWQPYSMVLSKNTLHQDEFNRCCQYGHPAGMICRMNWMERQS